MKEFKGTPTEFNRWVLGYLLNPPYTKEELRFNENGNPILYAFSPYTMLIEWSELSHSGNKRWIPSSFTIYRETDGSTELLYESEKQIVGPMGETFQIKYNRTIYNCDDLATETCDHYYDAYEELIFSKLPNKICYYDFPDNPDAVYCIIYTDTGAYYKYNDPQYNTFFMNSSTLRINIASEIKSVSSYKMIKESENEKIIKIIKATDRISEIQRPKTTIERICFFVKEDEFRWKCEEVVTVSTLDDGIPDAHNTYTQRLFHLDEAGYITGVDCFRNGFYSEIITKFKFSRENNSAYAKILAEIEM